MAQHFCEVCGGESTLDHMFMVFSVDALVNLNHPEITSNVAGEFFFRGQHMNYHLQVDRFMNVQGEIGLIVRAGGHHLICSEKCSKSYSDKTATYFNDHFLNAPLVKLPTEHGYFPYLFSLDFSNHTIGSCRNCNEQFALTDKVYRGVGIRQFEVKTGTYRNAADYSKTYDFALIDLPQGDTSAGNIYLYYLNLSDLQNPNQRFNFCTNECAYSYSVRNAMAFMFTDALNKGARKWIVPQMREINKKLKNAFEYRGVG